MFTDTIASVFSDPSSFLGMMLIEVDEYPVGCTENASDICSDMVLWE
jgi:hypothetical protein